MTSFRARPTRQYPAFANRANLHTRAVGDQFVFSVKRKIGDAGALINMDADA